MKTYNNFSPAERMRALHWLRAEYDAGKRQRPTKCDACGQDEGPIEAHSEDYSEPFGPHIGRFGLFYRCNAMLHCHLRYMTAWSIYKEQLREGPNLRADC